MCSLTVCYALRPELGPGLLSHGLAFIQRLDRPPQLAGQIVTFAACTAFRNIALAHSASAAVAGKGIISILAFVPLLQWLCTCKETPLMGEEYRKRKYAPARL